MTAPRLAVRGLYAGYRGSAVVRDVTLDVAAGEVVAIFGPNGAGKTTTLLTIMEMLPRLAGQVRWDGADQRLPAYRRARAGAAFVGERSVLARLSVEANLRLGRGDPQRALALFPELRPLLRRRAGKLSGGEQQMLTIGRALAGEPSVLLLDEVSSGLAPIIIDRLFQAVREAANRGIAVLLVEQQVLGALRIADRVLVLNQGELVFSGTREQIADQPDLLRQGYFSAR
jgi:branched-chain amino acid transport system ATP-binding protein